jgi:hypothetical protein
VPSVTLSATDALITAGARGRDVITITNTDGTNNALIRAYARNVGSTSSSNLSYTILPGRTFIARASIEGRDLAESAYFGIASAATVVITWEGSPN